MRMFKPSKPDKTKVHCWTWTKGRGLCVTYKDNITRKSAWTLPELLKADYKSGDGLPAIEVKTA